MDWSNLEEGPAGMIAERLLANDVADYIRFRAVCHPWRQCSADPRAHGVLDRRYHPRRWIMLREEVAEDPDLRRLINLSTGQCVRVHLPELRGHTVCSPTVEGLLVLLNRHTYALRLLNPLTRQVTDLPPATTLYPRPLYRNAAVYGHPRVDVDFEVSGAGLVDDATVAVLFEDVQMLAVAKPGDEQWTRVKQGTLLSPAISFAGRFYCTTYEDVMMLDTRDNNQPPGVHLLDNDGEMMMLTHTFTAESRHFEYKGFRVDLDSREIQPISDLGGRAVFIGYSRAISLSPSAFPTIRNDSLYLGKDPVMGNHLENTGPYKLVDGRGTTMNSDEGGGITEGFGFENNDKDSITLYGPHSIVDYLSQYVTKGT